MINNDVLRAIRYMLDLSDGTTAQALGIQASDGARARRQVLELRRMVEALTRTERDD